MKYSKAARRRNKKAMPQLAETPRREKSGCFVERTRQIQEDPQATVLKARARLMGGGDIAKMKNPMLGFNAGRALWNDKDRDELWKTYDACLSAYDWYQRQKTGMSIYAKTAKLEMMPERFETNADDAPVDDRTDEERHDAAVRTWDTWERALTSLPLAQSACVYSAMHGWSTLVTYSGWPTRQGKAFIEAVKALHEVMRDE